MCFQVLPAQTVAIDEGSNYDFFFEGVSGNRYEVTARTGAGSGGRAPCTSNSYENADNQPTTTCSAILSSGQSDCGSGDNSCSYPRDGECDDGSTGGTAYCSAGTDSADCGFGPTGVYAHYCDAECGFMCEQLGIQNTVLFVLPPGATDSAHSIATNTIVAADKAIGFTSSSTGKYTVRVRAHNGGGDITVSVENVGTTLHRSPPLRDDGLPHPLHVDCYFDSCTYSYSGGVILDADGRGFDLQFAAQAGVSYALQAQSQDAVKLKLTVYQQGAAQGADGFPAMIDSAMGSWYSTPAVLQKPALTTCLL